MPGCDLGNLGLSLCLYIGKKLFLSEDEQRKGRRPLMNLTTFFVVSYSALHIVTPG
jgi:hypothetical protein